MFFIECDVIFWFVKSHSHFMGVKVIRNEDQETVYKDIKAKVMAAWSRHRVRVFSPIPANVPSKAIKEILCSSALLNLRRFVAQG